jgi:threonine dehydrogenase-like Zn-dependent dehydrogenase
VAGDILGHEFMGRVVDDRAGSTLKKGQRVVVPFTISCGKCFFCEKQLYSACDNSNPVEKQDAPRRSTATPCRRSSAIRT